LIKIDIHTHILPPDLPKFKEKFGYGGFVSLEKIGTCNATLVSDSGVAFRDIESNCFDPALRIQDCDEQGVNIQVISTVPVMFSYFAEPKDGLEVSKFLNDHIAQVVAENPTRFIGLGTLPMQAPDLAIAELERCVTKLGLPGVQIGTHINDWTLAEESLFPVFQAAQDLGACIMVHPWDMMGANLMKKYFLPYVVGMPAETSLAICSMIFGGIFERLPKLRVAFVHGGGSFPHTLGRIAHGFEVRPDLCAVDNAINPREYIDRFYVDSLVHDKAAFKYILDLFGEKRIALGSDYPFPLGETPAGKLIDSISELSESTRERLFSGTALEWLGMTRADLNLVDGALTGKGASKAK
jgi:aminocarboxymuconate-semialdehyde decarboxylase